MLLAESRVEMSWDDWGAEIDGGAAEGLWHGAEGADAAGSGWGFQEAWPGQGNDSGGAAAASDDGAGEWSGDWQESDNSTNPVSSRVQAPASQRAAPPAEVVKAPWRVVEQTIGGRGSVARSPALEMLRLQVKRKTGAGVLAVETDECLELKLTGGSAEDRLSAKTFLQGILKGWMEALAYQEEEEECPEKEDDAASGWGVAATTATKGKGAACGKQGGHAAKGKANAQGEADQQLSAGKGIRQVQMYNIGLATGQQSAATAVVGGKAGGKLKGAAASANHQPSSAGDASSPGLPWMPPPKGAAKGKGAAASAASPALGQAQHQQWRPQYQQALGAGPDENEGEEAEDEETMTLPDRAAVAALFGKGGDTIKRLRADSGAAVKVDAAAATVCITGSFEAVDRARGMVYDVLQILAQKGKVDSPEWTDEAIVKIPRASSQRLEAAKTQIEKDTWATLTVEGAENARDPHTAKVHITGAPQAVEQARVKVKEAIGQSAGSQASRKDEGDAEATTWSNPYYQEDGADVDASWDKNDKKRKWTGDDGWNSWNQGHDSWSSWT